MFCVFELFVPFYTFQNHLLNCRNLIEPIKCPLVFPYVDVLNIPSLISLRGLK